VSFTPRVLRFALDGIRREGPVTGDSWCVALSGGLDSTVLLSAMGALRSQGAIAELRAIHVDHGLHPDSRFWSEHCSALAARLGVGCAVTRVEATAAPGDSPEAAARAARYRALATALRPGEILVTAHHADDQLEGVLLQWLRGGGLRSIAGMRPVTPFGPGWLARPLLAFPRTDLAAWADREGLDWLEDPSNRDLRYDRNFLRHEVLPGLRGRWPAAARTVGRVAEQAAEMLALDAQAAEVDLGVLCDGDTLSLPRLRMLPAARQRRAVRAWLSRRGLPVPSAATLETLRHDMLSAARERIPETHWPGASVHRYRDRLYAEPDVADAGAWLPGTWQPGETFDLGSAGRLELRPADGAGLARERLVLPLRVTRRAPGGTFRPAGSQHRRPLGKWLQERGVLPWRRELLPLLWSGDDLVAVGDLACGGPAAARDGEASWRIVWHGRPVLTEEEARSGSG
jgi:tRNA(Ile)-lysidine synthase